MPALRPIAWRLAVALGVTLLGGVFFVTPRYGSWLPDTGGLLFGVLPSGPTAHIVLFLVGTIVWGWALPYMRLRRLAAAGLVLAAVMESLQLLPMVRRSANWEDCGFNVIGLLLGLMVLGATRRRGAWSGPRRRPVPGGKPESSSVVTGAEVE